VCEAALEHITSALKILKAKAPASMEATRRDDPWWNGSDPWSYAHAKSGPRDVSADSQLQKLQPAQDIAKNLGSTENGTVSRAFNPDAQVFTPFLKLPSFAPAVCDVEGSLQIQLNKLSETVAALDRKVETLCKQVPASVSQSAGEACVGDNSAEAIPNLETTMDVNKLYAELLDTQNFVEKEFHEYDDFLTDISSKLKVLDDLTGLHSEKIDGAEGLFREIQLTESRILEYSDRWWKAEKMNDNSIDDALENMKRAGAPEWAILEARFRYKHSAKINAQYHTVAHEINKLWRQVCPNGNEDSSGEG